jgi:periplasmic protein CpxP/Spy
MKTTTLAGLALAVGLAGALPAASFAQADPRGAEGYAPEARAERPMMRQRMSPEQRIERRAERLRVMLQLRPEQERALDAYVASLQAGRGDRMARRAERRELRQLSTPERLRAQRERLAERLERFDRRAEATSRFYAQLTPSQRQAFDAMGAQRGGRGMRHRGGRGGMGPGPRG